MPIVRVRPRTPQQREDARFQQLRFGRYATPKGPVPPRPRQAPPTPVVEAPAPTWPPLMLLGG